MSASRTGNSRNYALPGRRFSALWLAVSVLVSAVPAWALAAYRRLWVRQYSASYTSMTCLLCHASYGGSELTPYGQDFQRYGATPAAFKTIERLDSDGDGSKNLNEIAAKANPGDARSTPANPGNWLQNIEKSALPTEQLEKLFPGVKTFTVLEGALSELERSGVQLIDRSPRRGAEGLMIAFLHPKSTHGVLTELCSKP